MRVLRLMMRIYYLVLTVALTSALGNVTSSTLLHSQPNWRLAYSAMQALERGEYRLFEEMMCMWAVPETHVSMRQRYKVQR